MFDVEDMEHRLALFAVVIALILMGCGAELKTQTRIAGGFVEVAAASAEIIRAGRVEAGIEAAREVRDRAGTIDEAREAADIATGRWSCAIDGHRVFSLGVRTYVDRLTLSAAGGEFELVMVLPIMGRVISAYGSLQTCLTSLGVDALPETPGFFDLIPTEWRLPE